MHNMAPEETWDTLEHHSFIEQARAIINLEDTYYGVHTSPRDWSAIFRYQSLPHLQELSVSFARFTDPACLRMGSLYAPALRKLTTNVSFALDAYSLTSLHAVGSIWHVELSLEFLDLFPNLRELIVNSVFGDLEVAAQDISEESLQTAEQMNLRVANAIKTIALPELWSLKFVAAALNACRLLDHIHVQTYCPECMGET